MCEYNVVCLTEHEDVEKMIKEHLTWLEEVVMLKDAWKHIMIEANMSYISADQVASWCRQFQRVIVEERDTTGAGRCGVWTGPYEKEAYAWTLRDVIKQNSIRWSINMVGHNIDRDKKALIAQLKNFRLERQDPADPAFGKYKYSFTGKTGGGQKDDFVLALQILLYWAEVKRQETQFKLFAQRQGIKL